MKIELHSIPIREIVEGYSDTGEGGVTGYGGKLNIRPSFQREFIYSEEQQRAVISTILKGFPLNVMYWIINDEGSFEMLDGQQRTLSICSYVNNGFSITDSDNYAKHFTSLTTGRQSKILDYELMIYICEGTHDEKLDWFRTINIAGEKLTEQEQRNAIYSGTWLNHAKSYFSRRNCPASQKASQYMSGQSIRQEYLETVIRWIADRDGITAKDSVSSYMSIHQHDDNSTDMWLYFNGVIEWVKCLFPEYRKEMQKVEWGLLWNAHHNEKFSPSELSGRVDELMSDYDVTRKQGIYEYLLDGEEKHLSIRKFPDRDKRTAYERQNGICPVCGKHFEINQMDADHIVAWNKGGHTLPENCRMLCKSCNRKKSDK